MAQTAITAQEREIFGKVADFLIPAYKRMPAATEVGVHRELLDNVLGFRPDLMEAFRRGLSRIASEKDARKGANLLYQEDRASFDALSLVASAAYYMTPRVRELIGYPGQENVPYDPHETPSYLTDGRLENVVRRGLIYRSTPR